MESDQILNLIPLKGYPCGTCYKGVRDTQEAPESHLKYGTYRAVKAEYGTNKTVKAEYGTNKTVKVRFWPLLPGESP